MEMENDGYGADSAIADLVNRLNAATAPGTWAFVDPDAALGGTNVAGDDAIKVGLLYRPGRGHAGRRGRRSSTSSRTSSSGTRVVADVRRPPTAQRVSVVVNHFKSKGCDGADRRRRSTRATARAAGTRAAPRRRRSSRRGSAAPSSRPPATPTSSSSATSTPTRRRTRSSRWRRPATPTWSRRTAATNAYSYVFDGQWGYLDHALASASLRPQVTGAGDFHINADEPSVLDYNTNFKSPGQVASLYAPDAFRTSDHDPVLVGLSPAKAASTTMVTSSANPATLGQPVTFTATVSASRAGLTPTGSVRFYVAGVPVSGNVALAGGVATSPALTLPPSQAPVEARYGGDAAVAASTGRLSQRVEYGFPALVSPVDGARVTAGSTVPVRFRLTDAAGRPLPDAAAALLVASPALCQVKVTVAGAQILPPTCVRYDAATDRFTYDWRTSRSGTGAVQLTVRVSIVGGAPQTRTVNLTLAG